MSGRVRPRPLRVGDLVAVVAPSGPLDPVRLERGFTLLRSWGLTVAAGAHVLARAGSPLGYLAGADAERAADLQRAWTDPQVAAVLCARGGYGATRLLPFLDWDAMRAAGPKVLLGSSDITGLHDAFAVELGLVTLFGPMVAAEVVAGESPDPVTVEELRRALLAPETATELTGRDTRTVVAGRAEGTLGGGTLALLAASVGTPFARPAREGIVVLEDVGEPGYRLDRYLTQLLLAGWFDGVRGIALGSWVDCGADAEDVVIERLAPLGVPLLAGLPFGHGRPQLTVPLGARATLDADARALSVLGAE
ncbi:MAG: LD-carboxypeptidase [Actinomycetota bacterium]|nr:LD-carboxypeptidase [Actinomycetota bacterium]MDP9461097.1 LD-carboxypeptidase [Actinomycetota bacterium]